MEPINLDTARKAQEGTDPKLEKAISAKAEMLTRKANEMIAEKPFQGRWCIELDFVPARDSKHNNIAIQAAERAGKSFEDTKQYQAEVVLHMPGALVLTEAAREKR